MKKIKVAEYIWLDGTKPTDQLRSKAKVITLLENPKVTDFPEWSFGGSSTQQAARQ